VRRNGKKWLRKSTKDTEGGKRPNLGPEKREENPCPNGGRGGLGGEKGGGGTLFVGQ